MIQRRDWLGMLVLVAVAAVATADEAADKATVMALEKAWAAASNKQDVDALKSILADDFVGFDGRGFRSDKDAELREIAPPIAGAPVPPLTFISEERSDIEIRVFGTAAVLTALNTAKFNSKDGESTMRWRRTTVWAKRNGRWQCVSFHASRLMEPRKS